MRKAQKEPMSVRAEKLILKRLFQLKERGHDPNEALDQSVIHNWINVYEPKPLQAANLKGEPTYEQEVMTPEQKAASDAIRKQVMAAFELKRVA